MVENKTKKTTASVDDFLGTVDDENKRKDAKKLNKIIQEVTGEKPVMWGNSIVGYGKYSYKTADGKQHEWMLVGFSPRKANLSIYIMAGFDEDAENNGYDPRPLLNKLGKHSTAKTCLYVKSLSDIDLETLKQLISDSVEVLKSK